MQVLARSLVESLFAYCEAEGLEQLRLFLSTDLRLLSKMEHEAKVVGFESMGFEVFAEDETLSINSSTNCEFSEKDMV